MNIIYVMESNIKAYRINNTIIIEILIFTDNAGLQVHALASKYFQP